MRMEDGKWATPISPFAAHMGAAYFGRAAQLAERCVGEPPRDSAGKVQTVSTIENTDELWETCKPLTSDEDWPWPDDPSDRRWTVDASIDQPTIVVNSDGTDVVRLPPNALLVLVEVEQQRKLLDRDSKYMREENASMEQLSGFTGIVGNMLRTLDFTPDESKLIVGDFGAPSSLKNIVGGAPLRGSDAVDSLADEMTRRVTPSIASNFFRGLKDACERVVAGEYTQIIGAMTEMRRGFVPDTPARPGWRMVALAGHWLDATGFGRESNLNANQRETVSLFADWANHVDDVANSLHDRIYEQEATIKKGVDR